MQEPNQMAVTKTYSLTMGHIGKVAVMSEASKKSQGEIVRIAIDLLFEKPDLWTAQQSEQETPAPTAG